MENLSTLSEADLDRFWSHVDRTGTCWEWTASKYRGYGQMVLRKDGRQVKFIAHRVSYWASNGHITESMSIDHVCHNRGCVNPDHLRETTVKQNNENLIGAQARNVSGVRGVTWHHPTQLWRSRVIHNRQEHMVGYFRTIEEAEAAAVAKRLELFTHNDADRVA